MYKSLWVAAFVASYSCGWSIAHPLGGAWWPMWKHFLMSAPHRLPESVEAAGSPFSALSDGLVCGRYSLSKTPEVIEYDDVVVVVVFLRPCRSEVRAGHLWSDHRLGTTALW